MKKSIQNLGLALGLCALAACSAAQGESAGTTTISEAPACEDKAAECEAAKSECSAEEVAAAKEDSCCAEEASDS